MTEASVPQDLLFYEYEHSCPLPSRRETKDHVISKGPCQPKDIIFPLDNWNRKFLVSWYEKFPWLEYSVLLDKAFCFVCRVFSAQVGYPCDLIIIIIIIIIVIIIMVYSTRSTRWLFPY